MKTKPSTALIGFAFWSCSIQAVTIDLVTVGNAGNPADYRYSNNGVGRVGYVYQMGKYDVTTGQYAEFLNAVATSDTYGLYTAFMDANKSNSLGCNIKQTGSPGGFRYDVAPDWANRPVNFVSWLSSARFCNWLSNGQPTGAQGPETTETGAYALNGARTSTELGTLVRNLGAGYVLPTLDEWYKAAYYDPNKPGGAGFWDYPTRSRDVPSNALDPNGTNNANYHIGGPESPDYTIGPPYYRTEVGAFASSPGPYGTFDQAGNVLQWVETAQPNVLQWRRLAGGSFIGQGESSRADNNASSEGGSDAVVLNYRFGFRVAYVPEPAALLLMIAGAMAAQVHHRGTPRL